MLGSPTAICSAISLARRSGGSAASASPSASSRTPSSWWSERRLCSSPSGSASAIASPSSARASSTVPRSTARWADVRKRRKAKRPGLLGEIGELRCVLVRTAPASGCDLDGSQPETAPGFRPDVATVDRAGEDPFVRGARGVELESEA